MGNTYLPWQVKAAAYISKRKADILLLPGGFGSGKTAVNANIIRDLCLKAEKPLHGLVIGNTFSTIRDTVGITLIEELSTVLKETKFSPPMEWKVHNSTLFSRTMRYGHEARQRLKGINADFLWLIEATELPREAYTMGISRLRRSGENDYYPIIIETNPSNKSNWVYKTFIDNAKTIWESDDKTYWIQQKVIEYEDENHKITTLKVIIIHTTTKANPHFPSKQLANMRETYSASEYERLVNGVWNAMEGRVWEYYTTFKHPSEMVKYAAKYDKIIIGIDPGQTHPTALVMIGYSAGVWEVFDEYYETNRSVLEVYKELGKRIDSWGLQQSGLQVWIDPSAKQYLREWQVIPGNNNYIYSATHKGTDPALNRAIKLGERLRTKRLVISSLCKYVIQDIEQAIYKEDVIKETVDKAKYDPHAMDAVGYAMSREM